MERKVSFIIGNGFNYFVSNYLNSTLHDDLIVAKEKSTGSKDEDISWRKDVQLILNEYCHLLDDITLPSKYDYNGEFLLEQLFSFFKGLDIEEKMISMIEEAVCRKVKEKMDNCQGTVKTEHIPKTVRTFFKIEKAEKGKYSYFSFCLLNLFKKYNLNELNVFTTNYDDIVHYVFQTDFNGDIPERKGIHYTALHGDYLLNDIVCTVPILKEKAVSDKLIAFEDSIENSEVIVLFGLGLSSDPHILKRLNSVKDKVFIIFDACREKYMEAKLYCSSKNRVGYDFLFNNKIFFKDTLKSYYYENGMMKLPVQKPEDILFEIEDVLMKLD